jgi:hypothetical protein
LTDPRCRLLVLFAIVFWLGMIAHAAIKRAETTEKYVASLEDRAADAEVSYDTLQRIRTNHYQGMRYYTDKLQQYQRVLSVLSPEEMWRVRLALAREERERDHPPPPPGPDQDQLDDQRRRAAAGTDQAVVLGHRDRG